MPKIQHEKLKVLIPCINKCKALEKDGAIIEWRRLDALDYSHVNGSPDIEIRFIKDATLWLLMVECKRPGGGVHLDSQKEYSAKYDICHNVVYIIVESVAEMSSTLEKLSDYYNRKITEIIF